MDSKISSGLPFSLTLTPDPKSVEAGAGVKNMVLEKNALCYVSIFSVL